ncbi:MAG: hypothetical protein WBM90_08455, partial [Acidimicrobiia bacterium]
LLAGIVAETNQIEREIAELMPTPSADQEQLIEDLALLNAQIDSINARLIELVVLEAGADPETRAAIAIERANLNSQLTRLRGEIAALDPIEPPALSVEDELLLAALQARLESLSSEYQRLYLRKLGVTGSGGVEPVVVMELTPEPLDPVISASIGLLGGLLVALLAIIFITRTRKTVWLAEDIDLPLLGEVPSRKIGANTAENWYDTAEAGPRKSAIQALRSSVEAQVSPGGGTIALTAHNVQSEVVQALAADLASSLASAGTSVLLVDANFGSRSPMGQYKVGGASVAHVLELNPGAPEFAAQVNHTVEGAFLVRSGLSVIPSGPAPSSPADALAGRQFRELVSRAQSEYDIVVVVVDDVASPSAQVALQRLGYGVLVLTPGTVTTPEVDVILNDLNRLRIGMLGAVFVNKEDRIFSAVRPAKVQTPEPPVATSAAPQPQQSPIARLHNYPIPEQRRSAVVQHGSLDDLADHIGASGGRKLRDSGFGLALLAAINEASPAQAYESVSEYLISQTEDMVTARFGLGGLSDELIEAVENDGFISLKQLAGYRTPAAWISHEIEADVDARTAVDLIDAMERALGHGAPRRIDSWLEEEFFARHLDRMGGEPAVWHIRSPEGTIAILIAARRMEIAGLERIVSDVVSREVDDLERFRRSMITRGDFEQADVFEGQIHDVRQFERAVVSLMSGETIKGKGATSLWKPDWSKGTRANLAPIQRAGLLPFKVLSDDEMASVLASA